MEHKIEIRKTIETDVFVLGGGTAGVAAAVSAARNGAKVVLADRNSILGGMATSGLVGPFMTCYDNDCSEQVVKGIFDEVCRRMEEKDGAIHPSKISGMGKWNSYYIRSHEHVTPFFSETLAVVMDEMVSEAGVKVLFNTSLADVVVKDNKIEGVVVLMKEGCCMIKAKSFIDCSGDADMAYFAGVPCVYGDGKNANPCSLFFEVDNVDDDVYCAELEKHKSELDNHMGNCFSWLIKDAKKNGTWKIDKNEIGMYAQPVKGRWKVNTTRMSFVDARDTDDVTKAMMEGRKQIQHIIEFMRENIPGCKNVQLVQVASQLGVRESRHVKCLYELNTNDIMGRKCFDDAVCTYAYAIDIHLPVGGGTEFTCVDHYYTIPYRSLVAADCRNLLIAGRCIGGTSEAAASYRVMPACFATGQAAGTAAALAVKHSVDSKEVDYTELCGLLEKQGAVIKRK